MAITHAFTSAKPDGGDATLVRPSDWNADHEGVTEGLPLADPTGVTIDTTTYDNAFSGVGKLTTLILPAGSSALFAMAIEGDAFPRVVMGDPLSQGYYFGDGTVNPTNDGPAWWINGPDANGYFSQTFEGGKGAGQRMEFGGLNPNAGYGTEFSAPPESVFRISAEGATPTTPFTISAGVGVPALGGNVGDIYFRQDPGGANQTIYRCTVAGTAGNATWVGIL